MRFNFFDIWGSQVYKSRSATDAAASEPRVLYKTGDGFAQAHVRRNIPHCRAAQQTLHQDAASQRLVHERRVWGVLGKFSLIF